MTRNDSSPRLRASAVIGGSRSFTQYMHVSLSYQAFGWKRTSTFLFQPSRSRCVMRMPLPRKQTSGRGWSQ